MTSPHEQALAACPFCGGEARYAFQKDSFENHEHVLQCWTCGGGFQSHSWDHEPEDIPARMATAWNRRAALPAPDLAEWEKAAEGVTKGPWFRSGVRGKAAQLGGGSSIAEYHSISRYDEAKKTDENIAAVWYDPRTGLGLNDAAWIARCSPDNVLSAFRSLSAKLAAVERERDATRELLTDLADAFERFLGDLGHPQDSWQRDQIARARKETPDAQ